MNAEGIKEILLEFTATKEPAKYNSIAFHKGFGFDHFTNRFNRVFQKRDLIRSTSRVTIERAALNQKPDLDPPVRRLVSQYIANISENSNVINLMPDMFDALNNQIGKLNGNENKNLRNPGAPSPWARAPGVKLAPDPVKPPTDKRDYLKETLALLDINLSPVITPKALNVPIGLDAAQEADSPVDTHKVTLSMGNTSRYAEGQLIMHGWALTPLYNYIEGLKGMMDLGEIEFIEETDLRILKLWKKYGLIIDPNKPTLILGSQKLIKEILYLDNVQEFEDVNTRSNGISKIFKPYYEGGYRREYFELFRKTASNSSFGEDVSVKDELALNEELRSFTSKAGIPIFRYNMRNPNVLGLEVDYLGSYFDVYNAGIMKKTIEPALNSSRQDIIRQASQVVDPATLEIIELLLRETTDLPENKLSTTDIIIRELVNENTSLFLGDLPGAVEQAGLSDTLTVGQLAIYIKLLLEDTYGRYDNQGITIETDEQSIASKQKALMDEIGRMSLRVRLRTLPFFNLKLYPVKKCLLYGITNSVIGAKNVKQLAPFSRAYTIMGYRHFLSGDEMFSEFELVVQDSESSEAGVVTTQDGDKKVKDLIVKIEKEQEERSKGQNKIINTPIDPLNPEASNLGPIRFIPGSLAKPIPSGGIF